MKCPDCEGKTYRIVGREPDGSDDHEEPCERCDERGCLCDECGEGTANDLCRDCDAEKKRALDADEWRDRRRDDRIDFPEDYR